MLPDCWPLPCTCVSGDLQERHLPKTTYRYDAIAPPLNGAYVLGYLRPDPSTLKLTTLDSRASNVTPGTFEHLPVWPGEYQYRVQATINTTNCNILPGVTPEIAALIHVRTTLHKGCIDHIYVSPCAGITSADLPGVQVIPDPNGVHDNHFHVGICDPDGPDSNSCEA